MDCFIKKYGNVTPYHNAYNEYQITKELHGIYPHNVPNVLGSPNLDVIVTEPIETNEYFDKYLLNQDYICTIELFLRGLNKLDLVNSRVLELNAISLKQKFERGFNTLYKKNISNTLKEMYKCESCAVINNVATIHGDLNLSNISCINSKVKVLDFEYLCFGNPDYDIATYLSSVLIHLTNGSKMYNSDPLINKSITINVSNKEQFSKLFAFSF